MKIREMMNQIEIHNNLDISFQNKILISSAIVENFLKKYYSSWETFVETPFAFLTDFSLYNECMSENLSKLLDAFKMEYNPIENYDGYEKTTTNYGEHTTFNKQGSQLLENNYGETNNENIESVTTNDTTTFFDTNKNNAKILAHTDKNNIGARIDELQSITHTDTVEIEKHGNMGVTSTQNMLNQEYELRRKNIIYDYLHQLANNLYAYLGGDD